MHVLYKQVPILWRSLSSRLSGKPRARKMFFISVVAKSSSAELYPATLIEKQVITINCIMLLIQVPCTTVFIPQNTFKTPIYSPGTDTGRAVTCELSAGVITHTAVAQCVCILWNIVWCIFFFFFRRRRGAINAKQLTYLEQYKPSKLLKEKGAANCCIQWGADRVLDKTDTNY